MKTTKDKLQEYCLDQSNIIASMAGMPGRRVSNDSYIDIRNGLYISLPRHLVNRATFELTTLLAFVSIIGYPDEARNQ